MSTTEQNMAYRNITTSYTGTLVVTICLHITNICMCLVYTLNSAKQVLLPNLDCSLEGFTAFHLLYFYKSYVTVALSNYSNRILRLRLFHCRQINALIYCFIKHEHYSHLRLCEHGLSSISL